MRVINKRKIKRIERVLMRMLKMEYLPTESLYVEVFEVKYDAYSDFTTLIVKYGNDSIDRTVEFTYYGLGLLRGQFLQAIIEEI